MQSKAQTVDQYLAGLPPDRRAAIDQVRATILKNLDEDYVEVMQYGMIGYAVPHSVFPDGYHCDPRQPLPFAALASQKGYMSLHLMSVYLNEAEAARFREAWRKTGKKLDMGKACIRFKSAADLPLDLIGATIRRTPAKSYIGQYVAIRDSRGSAKKSPPAARKSAAKPAAAAKRPARKNSAPARKK